MQKRRQAGLLTEGERTTDAQFYDFIERQPSRWPIFVATDNAVSQQRFVSRYGDRVKALKRILLLPRDIYRFCGSCKMLVKLLASMMSKAPKNLPQMTPLLKMSSSSSSNDANNPSTCSH